jgi:hypothetical protein
VVGPSALAAHGDAGCTTVTNWRKPHTLADKARSLVSWPDFLGELAGIGKFADTPAGNVSRWRRCAESQCIYETFVVSEIRRKPAASPGVALPVNLPEALVRAPPHTRP